MRYLIIEDEPMAVKRLQNMMHLLRPHATLLGDLDTVHEAVQWLTSHEMPDLILLDIHLADGSSFELFRQVSVTCPIVFCTAYDQYALQAFQVNAVDYLLKPIKAQELARSLEKLEQWRTISPDYSALAEAVIQQQVPQYQQRLLAKYGTRYRLVAVSDVAYAYIEDRIVYVVTHEGARPYPIDFTLDQLEQRLDPSRFYRVNRQVIAAIDAIESLVTLSRSRLKIELHPTPSFEVLVSKERTAAFRQWLTQ